MKKFIKDYFTFSRRERNGVLVLLTLIAITLLLPYTYPYLFPPEKIDFSEFEADVKRFREAVAANANKGVNEYDDEWADSEDDVDGFDEEEPKEPFDFNPNELTYEQGRALGLSHKIALRITKYLKAKGHFYKKEDLKKIYDFSDEDYERLAPFAIFEEEEGSESGKKKPYKRKDFEGKKDKKRFDKKKFEETDTPIEVKLFSFDPNKVTYDEARQLGLSNQAAKALVNFVKGGMVFRKKEDFKKVYGVTESDYERLQDFIRIEAEPAIAEEKGEGASKYERQKPKTFQKFEEKEPISVDINTATAEDWKQLKGIGPSFSNRIIKYRDLLGGFTSPLQLKEVYGLDAILYVEIQDFLKNESLETIKTININLADELTLKKHPYIDAKLAKNIVKRRIKRGDYQAIDEIQKIGGVDDVLFEKLSPYLNVH